METNAVLMDAKLCVCQLSLPSLFEAQMVFQDQTVILEQLEPQELKEQLEPQESKEMMDQLVLLVLLDHEDELENQVLQEK